MDGDPDPSPASAAPAGSFDVPELPFPCPRLPHPSAESAGEPLSRRMRQSRRSVRAGCPAWIPAGWPPRSVPPPSARGEAAWAVSTRLATPVVRTSSLRATAFPNTSRRRSRQSRAMACTGWPSSVSRRPVMRALPRISGGDACCVTSASPKPPSAGHQPWPSWPGSSRSGIPPVAPRFHADVFEDIEQVLNQGLCPQRLPLKHAMSVTSMWPVSW